MSHIVMQNNSNVSVLTYSFICANLYVNLTDARLYCDYSYSIYIYIFKI